MSEAPDPSRLTIGDVAEALAFIQRAWHLPINPLIPDPCETQRDRLKACPEYGRLCQWCEANLGREMSSDTMQAVISRLAVELRKPFAEVRSISLADALVILAATGDGRPKAGEKDEKERKPADPPLSEDQQFLLIAAYELSAFDSDSRQTAAKIVVRAKSKHADPANVKRSLSDLVHKELLHSKPSRGGGYWLTSEAMERAKRLKELIG
jgi:hypothetical protein